MITLKTNDALKWVRCIAKLCTAHIMSTLTLGLCVCV